MTRIYKSNFIYIAERYEEWQSGRCISSGEFDTRIVAEVYGNSIHFELSNKGNLRILDSFDFGIQDIHLNVLPDRVQYIKDTQDYNPILPIICNVFYSGDSIKYVRFAMTNPDRLIEFYGYVEKFGQPSRPQKNSPQLNQSADSILRELASYSMVNTEAVTERAVQLYNQNANVSSEKEGRSIIEALKLFIKVHELATDEEEGNPYMVPESLEFIALCNYKIGNYKQAYCIAKQGLDAVDDAIANSVLTGITKKMYGAENMEEVIRLIEENFSDSIDDIDDIWDADPEEIDTTIFERSVSIMASDGASPVKKGTIETMVKAVKEVQRIYTEAGEKNGDTQIFMITMSLELFLHPLYYVWEKQKYGWHTDFLKEDSLFPYMMFEAQAKERTQSMLDCLVEHSPFTGIERDGIITKTLIQIYKYMLDNLL